jgi:hypothetical protein
MISFLRQIVHFESVYNEFIVGHAVFKDDFGPWSYNYHAEVLQIIVDNQGRIWLEEYCAALLIKKCQITLGVVA